MDRAPAGADLSARQTLLVGPCLAHSRLAITPGEVVSPRQFAAPQGGPIMLNPAGTAPRRWTRRCRQALR